MDHYWTIELLGGLSAVRLGERTTRFATLKTGSLLAYLAFYRKKTHLRETLADMLGRTRTRRKGDPASARCSLMSATCSNRPVPRPVQCWSPTDRRFG